jgi:hypothetical protein
MLRCVTIWTAREQLRAFETATCQRHIPVAGTQFGRAMFAPGATVLAQLGEADDARLRAAAAQDMRTALLVPVREGRATIAAVELLSRSSEAPDEELTVAIEAVALQFAHFRRLLRLAAAPRWRLGRL